MKKVKITTIILAIILVTLVAFAGVYIKTQNRMENKAKDYSFGRELEGERIIELKVITGEGENAVKPELLNKENYETVKNTIEKRFNALGAKDYTISLNEQNGTIIVELEENENTDIYVHYLVASGKVQIVEQDSKTELLSDSMVEKATYGYTSDIDGKYKVFADIVLTQEGQAKIEEIKNNYAVLKDEVEKIEAEKAEADKKKEEGEKTTEEKTTEEKTTVESKKIAKLTVGGTEYDIEKIEKNKIRILMGAETSNSTYVNSYINIAAEMTMLVNSGKYPLEYEMTDNRFEYTDITKEQIIYFAIAVAVILLISFIVLTIKYKAKGLLASISYIGFVSILTLLLRYTNVDISIEGIGAIILILAINLRVNQKILNETVVEAYKEVFLKLIPVIIITLVFCFAGVANLSSFGMIMFWGLALMAAYNVTITKTLLKLKESK